MKNRLPAALGLVLALLGPRLPAEPDRSPVVEPRVLVNPTPIAACVATLKDEAVPGQCTQASSAARLGSLYPITEDLFVTTTGEVGIGTTQPSSTLTVNGVIHSTSGGFRFPDGQVQTTRKTAGIQGPAGPSGATGAPGAQGDPGPPAVTPLNGLTGPTLSLVGSGGATVSTGFNVITVTVPAVPCTYNSKTYTTGQFCYTFGDAIPCATGFKQDRLVCQAGGTWQVITSSACNNPSLLPNCGF